MQQNIEKIKYIGVPFRSGANQEGAQLAPKWLLENMLVPESAYGLLHFPTEEMPMTDAVSEGVKNYDAVLQMISAVRTEVASSLMIGEKVVVLGGDHSIAMGSLSGVLEKYPSIGVIWFDAHTDINTEASSPSGNAHGMPLAALMGLCKSGINNQGVKLNPANVFWVGARDIDAGEWEIIRSLGIEDHVYTSEKVHQLGMNAVMTEIRNQLFENGVEHLHISFDVDGMDPLLVSATGAPVEMGLNEIDSDEFIDGLSEGKPTIVSMDFVEYNPLMDNEAHTTGKWCKRTLSNFIDIMEK